MLKQLKNRNSVLFSNKTFLWPIIAFLLPWLFYFAVFFGRSFGLDCAWGVMGFPPAYNQTPLTNDVYCKNIADVGAYAWQGVPQLIKVVNSYLNFSWPLWNQNNGIGVPLAANFISTAYFIPNILFALPKSIFAFDLYFIFRMSIVSLGMYLFLSSFKLPKIVSLTGSLIVFLNGYVTYIPTISHFNVDILLPWIAFLINKSFFTRKIKYFVFLSLVTAFSHLGGMPESSIFIVLFFGVYVTFLSLLIAEHINRLKFIKSFYLSLIFSFLIASILIIPGYEYITQGSSFHHPGIQQATSVDIRNIIFLPFPKLFGQLNESTSVFQPKIEFGIWSLEYIGMVAFFFLISSFIIVFFRRNELQKYYLKNYFFFFFFFLLILLFQYFGLFQNPILTKLPGFSQTNYPKYSLNLINFLIATNISFVIYYLVKVKNIFVVNISILFMLFFTVLIYFGLKDSVISVGKYDTFVKQLLFGSGIYFLICFCFVLKHKTKINKTLIYCFILIMAIGEFFVYIPHHGDMQRRDNLSTPPYIDFLKSYDYKDFRIFSPDRLLYPNYSAVYDLNDVRNIDALWPKLYYDYLKYFAVSDIDSRVMRFTGVIDDGTTNQNANVVNNPFFDLLSVKYYFTKKDIEIYNLNGVLGVIPDSISIYKDVFDINGLTRPVLFEHPNSSVKLDIIVPEGGRYFYLYPAMSPAIFKKPIISDGVKFTAIATNEGKELFRKELIIDPRKEENLKWFQFKIGPFNEIKNFQLILNTDQLNNNAADWAGWGGFEWDIGNNKTKTNQFTMVYDKEIKIYENNNFVPRIHPISKIICAKNDEEVVLLMNLNVNQIKDISINISDDCVTNDYDVSKVEINNQKFDDNRVTFDYDAKQDSFVVLSNVYYPGWKLKINGKENNIVRANFAMQGLFLPAGENMKVEVKYDPLSFKIGFSITILSLGFCFLVFISKYRNKKI